MFSGGWPAWFLKLLAFGETAFILKMKVRENGMIIKE